MPIRRIPALDDLEDPGYLANRDRRAWSAPADEYRENDDSPGAEASAGNQPERETRSQSDHPANGADGQDPDRDSEAGEIARLTRLVEEKDQRARESAVQARMAMEELERAKERIRKDASKELEQRRRSVIADFLDVLDDLERAIEAAGATGEDVDSSLARGVELVRKGFLAKLAKHDVTPMDTKGKPFDPACHEALSMVPVSDEELDGVIIGVIQQGYRIGDEVLRPAAVAVGKMS